MSSTKTYVSVPIPEGFEDFLTSCYDPKGWLFYQETPVVNGKISVAVYPYTYRLVIKDLVSLDEKTCWIMSDGTVLEDV